MQDLKSTASNKRRLDALFARHIDEAERKAGESLAKRKYIMFGYWKAIAVHLRKIRREFKKEDI